MKDDGMTLGDILAIALLAKEAKDFKDAKEAEEAMQGADKKQGVHTIGVCFKHDLNPSRGWVHNPNKVYTYLSCDDSIVVGDTVIVDSPTTGYTCVKVESVTKNTSAPTAMKWVVQRVDDSIYRMRQQAVRDHMTLSAKLEKRLQEHRRKMGLEHLARHDSEAAEMIAQLKTLDKLLGK